MQIQQQTVAYELLLGQCCDSLFTIAAVSCIYTAVSDISYGGGLLIPGLLFADDTSLFGEDVEGLERSLMVLEEWCSRWGMKVNVEKSAIIHFRKKSCLQWDHEFFHRRRGNPYGYKVQVLGVRH